MVTTATCTRADWLADALLDLNPGQRVYATGIPWAVYLKLAAFRDERRPGVKITFNRGEIELMSPSYRHEKPGVRLGHIVLALAEELGLEVIRTRSTTLRQDDVERGLEPDDCYYVAHCAAVIGATDIDWPSIRGRIWSSKWMKPTAPSRRNRSTPRWVCRNSGGTTTAK